MRSLNRVLALAEQFLLEADQLPLGHPDSDWPNAYGGHSHEYYNLNALDKFKKDLAGRAELRKGIQQELPFTVEKKPHRWTDEQWPLLNTNKPRYNRYTHKTLPVYRSPETEAKLKTWQAGAATHLKLQGFKRVPDHDAIGGDESAQHQSLSLAYEHTSGAKVIISHHVVRSYNSDVHPELGISSHAVYWAFRNDKGKKWGKRESLGQHGRIATPEPGKYYGRYDTKPHKDITIHDAAETARKKEGWQVVSHRLSEIPKFFSENPHAMGMHKKTEAKTLHTLGYLKLRSRIIFNGD